MMSGLMSLLTFGLLIGSACRVQAIAEDEDPKVSELQLLEILGQSSHPPNLSAEEALERQQTLYKLLGEETGLSKTNLLDVLQDGTVSVKKCDYWSLSTRLNNIELFKRRSVKIVPFLEANARAQLDICLIKIKEQIGNLDEGLKRKVRALVDSIQERRSETLDASRRLPNDRSTAEGLLAFMKQQEAFGRSGVENDKSFGYFVSEYRKHVTQPCRDVNQLIGPYVGIFFSHPPSYPLFASVDQQTFEWAKVSRVCKNINYLLAYELYKSS